MPAAQSAAFKPLRSISFDAVGTGRGRGGNRGAAPETPALAAAAGAGAGGRGGGQTNPRANWIGLAFTRADAYSRIAASLPAGDARSAVFTRLSDIHAEKGQQEVVTAAAFDAPWVGALAVSYLAKGGGTR